ncbi:MAG: transporter substrate-binding domain-containing protein [Bacteroidales bacterium]
MIRKMTRTAMIAVILIVVSVSGFAQETLKRIAERGELRVGMTATQPPFCMKAKDGSIIGYEVDLADMFASTMGVKLTIVEIPFDGLLDALESGKVDVVMSGMTMTLKRNMKVAFAGPYILSGKSILTKSPALSNTDDAEDLNDETIKLVVLRGSTSETYARTEIPDAEIILASSYEEAITALEEGSAEIMVADYPICAYTALVQPERGLITIDEPLTIEPIGIALPPNDAHFHNMVNNYLNGLMLVGILDILEVKWFDSGEWVELVK